MPKRTDIKKVMIIGSGPIVIGQACEFDYSGTQACKALRGLGYEIILVNSNPATIMTDPGMADVTYIEPLNIETMKQIIEEERPDILLGVVLFKVSNRMACKICNTRKIISYEVQVGNHWACCWLSIGCE